MPAINPATLKEAGKFLKKHGGKIITALATAELWKPMAIPCTTCPLRLLLQFLPTVCWCLPVIMAIEVVA